MYQNVFNALFDEKIDCFLKTSNLVEERMLNWNRINRKFHFWALTLFAEIMCFNYLQQRFYLVEPTMKSLAKGTSSDAIFKLLKVTINTQQQIFAEANEFTEGIEDIADKLETNKQLFEENNGVELVNKELEEEEEVKKSYVGE